MSLNPRVRQILKEAGPWLALSCSALLYVLHFYLGGGRTKLITDSDAYLLLARGQLLGAPYSSRVLEPFLVWIISSILGISSLAAFHLLTPAALLASLLVLRKLISNLGGSLEWQSTVLLVFGCGLAVTFGYTPVMVDPLLLLLTCLTVIALERGQFAASVVFACLAALTKEYGLLLGFVSCLYVYRRGKRTLAFTAALVPLIIFLVITSVRSRSAGVGVHHWTDFLSAMFGYHAYLFRFRGASEYPKLLYMWSWSALWPALIMATGVVFARMRNRIKMSGHEVSFTLMLVASPLLLLGDWGRALLIVVPFACAVATKHSLASNGRFVTLLAIGGLATALARPFHSDSPAPALFTIGVTVISALSSLLIGWSIVRFATSKPGANLSGPRPVRFGEAASS